MKDSDEETEQSDEPEKPSSEFTDGTLTFIVMYLFAWVVATIYYGVKGFSFLATPCVLFGLIWLFDKLTGED